MPGLKMGDQGQGIKPWTHKKIVLHGQGLKPWTHKNWLRARPGVQTLDRSKKIVRAIVHTIAKYDRARDRKISRAHETRADA